MSCADMRRSPSLYINPKKDSSVQNSFNTRRGIEAGRETEAEKEADAETEDRTTAEEELIALQYIETEPKYNKNPNFKKSGGSCYMWMMTP